MIISKREDYDVFKNKKKLLALAAISCSAKKESGEDKKKYKTLQLMMQNL